MSWKDQLINASFRGVPFKVSQSSAEFGRRIVAHEYPLRNIPFAEDLGRKQQQFTVEAYVIGDDYIAQRDRLIGAIEAAGSGRLDHPYYGVKTVVCVAPCRVQETIDEGRMARFSITFLEAGERKFPAASTDFFSKLGVASDALTAAASGDFTKLFSVVGLPDSVASGALGVIADFGTAMDLVKSGATAISDFSRSVGDLLGSATDLIRTPATLAHSIISSVTGIADIGLDTDGIATAYKSLLSFGDSSSQNVFNPGPDKISGTQTQINTNRQAVIDLVKRTAIAQASLAVVEKAKSSPKPGKLIGKIFTPLDPLQISREKIFPTREAIITERQIILDAIDEDMNRTLNDEVYQALMGQRRALIQAFPDPSQDIPSLISVTNAQTRPSLVLCYQLYESVDLEIDLVKRNQIERPGFVPGGSVLEVIRDG